MRTTRMNTFYKQCSANEIRLQGLVAELGLAPPILETDNATYMVMEVIPTMSIADYYGTTIRALPIWVRQQIISILRIIYIVYKIQYIDITPYNFIEHNGKVWIIDFGHAYDDERPLHPHLLQILNTEKLRWNKDFE